MANKEDDINMNVTKAAEKRLKQENRAFSTRTVTLDKDDDDRNLEDMEYMQNDDNIDINIQGDIKNNSDYLNDEKDAVMGIGDNKEEKSNEAGGSLDKNDVDRKQNEKPDRSRKSKSLNNSKRNVPKPRKDDAVKNGKSFGVRDKSPNKYHKQEQIKMTKRESVFKSLKPVSKNRKPLDSTNTREQPKPEQSKSLEEDDEYKEEFDELLAEQGYRYNDDDGRFDMIDDGGEWEESENVSCVQLHFNQNIAT